MKYVGGGVLITGQEPLSITGGGGWHDVVLLSREEGPGGCQNKETRND